MQTWSNIQLTPKDPEVTRINSLEKKLGKLSDKTVKIRELITRFEVCHFRYQQHIRKIKDSILTLEPNTDPAKIGITHVRHGENAWKNDTTGHSLNGQQYIWAMKKWLNDGSVIEITDIYNKEQGLQIQKWLDHKSPDKIRLVRLLLARLTWDWKSYEELQHGGKYKDLELQICATDICHYAFPANLDLILQAIGKMKPVENFEGCGSFDAKRKAFIEKELADLNSTIKSMYKGRQPDKDGLTRIWLNACLAKTLKEQVNISMPISIYSN